MFVFGISLVIALVLLLLFLAIYLSTGRGSRLIAGYNTLPAEEKDKYNAVELCKVIGHLLFLILIICIIIFLGAIFKVPWLIFVGILGIIISSIITVIYCNKNSKFKK